MSRWLTKKRRRKVHVASETVALAAGLPLAIYGAATPRLPVLARVGFGVLAAGTAIVDGVLLHSYLTERKNGKTLPPAEHVDDDEERHTLPTS